MSFQTRVNFNKKFRYYYRVAKCGALSTHVYRQNLYDDEYTLHKHMPAFVYVVFMNDLGALQHKNARTHTGSHLLYYTQQHRTHFRTLYFSQKIPHLNESADSAKRRFAHWMISVRINGHPANVRTFLCLYLFLSRSLSFRVRVRLCFYFGVFVFTIGPFQVNIFIVQNRYICKSNKYTHHFKLDEWCFVRCH